MGIGCRGKLVMDRAVEGGVAAGVVDTQQEMGDCVGFFWGCESKSKGFDAKCGKGAKFREGGPAMVEAGPSPFGFAQGQEDDVKRKTTT
jgi:hypothetical protein